MPAQAISYPRWFYWLVLVGLVIGVLQGLSNMKPRALRNLLEPYREVADNFGQYQRGWGMFGGTNTNTSTARVLFYSKGRLVDSWQVVYLRPGYKRVIWNEIAQDLQFDDNNDRNHSYLRQFLLVTCREWQEKNPEIDEARMEQQIIGLYNFDGYRLRDPETNIVSVVKCD